MILCSFWLCVSVCVCNALNGCVCTCVCVCVMVIEFIALFAFLEVANYLVTCVDFCNGIYTKKKTNKQINTFVLCVCAFSHIIKLNSCIVPLVAAYYYSHHKLLLVSNNNNSNKNNKNLNNNNKYIYICM